MQQQALRFSRPPFSCNNYSQNNSLKNPKQPPPPPTKNNLLRQKQKPDASAAYLLFLEVGHLDIALVLFPVIWYF